MGRGNRRNKGKRGRSDRSRPEPAWKDICKKNELMESFYQKQHIVPDDEWETFMKYCRKDLPSTFRITKIRGHAKDLLRSLKEGYIAKISAEDYILNNEEDDDAGEDGKEQVLMLEPIKWYPDELAWNSNLSRRFIRRSDVLKKLHRFLVEDSECGAITRQEAVSMIPPMLLDVKPHHLVLDMCAAPGSKTAQIIEMMHANDTEEIPTGAVLANDADHKRCYMLTHQANRLNTPCVIITNHDASIYPKLYTKNKATGEDQLLAFDRVLCDVPCSGDGTLRKNPIMWHRWSPHLGISLHRLQMRILIRGLELLKVGGRLVYSTCSFNPIENEAVLAGILSKVEGSVELVDCSKEIPDLKRQSGLKTWKVFDRKGQEYENFASVNCSPTEGVKESMFPPSLEVANELKLERCMRIYPHFQNTGGFFIAVLEKKDELPWQKLKRGRNAKYLPWEEEMKFNRDFKSEVTKEEDGKCSKESLLSNVESVADETLKESEETVPEDIIQGNTEEADDSSSTDKGIDENRTRSPPTKKFRRGMIKEDPYIFLDDSDKDIIDVRKFYDLSLELPTNQFLVRSTGFKKRHVYLVSEAVHQVMSKNSNLKVINTGVRIVTRSPFRAGVVNHGIEYRLVQDGLHLIQRYIKKRIIQILDDDFISLLEVGEIEKDKLTQKLQNDISMFEMGCIIWYYKANNSDCPSNKVQLTSDIWICGHIGRKVIQSMLSKEERKHFLRLLGHPIPASLEEKVKGPSWGDEPKRVDEPEKIDELKQASEEMKEE